MKEIEKEEQFRKKTDSLALGIRNSCGVAAESILNRFIKNKKYISDRKGDVKYTNAIMPELMIYAIYCFYSSSLWLSKKYIFIRKLLGKNIFSEGEIEVFCLVVKMRIMEKYVPDKFKNKFERSYEERIAVYKKSENFRSKFFNLIKLELEKIVKSVDSTDMLFVMHCIDKCAQEVITGDYKKYA